MFKKKIYLGIVFIVVFSGLFAVSKTAWTETLISFVDRPTRLSRSNIKDQMYFIKKATKKAYINGYSNGQRFEDYKGIDYYPNERGITPLVAACGNDRTDIVRLLIDYGADVNLPSKKGEYPIQRANKENNHNVVNLLLSSGAWSIQELADKQKQKENNLVNNFNSLPSVGNISSETDVLDIILTGNNYSPKEIKKIEGDKNFNEFADEGHYGLVYKTSNCQNQKCNIKYMIEDNQLNVILVSFNGKDLIRTDVIEVYQQIREEILDIYGSPIEDEQIWKDKEFIDDFDKWILAVKNGDLFYNCKWKKGSKIIGLIVSGVNNKSYINIIYVKATQNQNVDKMYNMFINNL